MVQEVLPHSLNAVIYRGVEVSIGFSNKKRFNKTAGRLLIKDLAKRYNGEI